MKSADLEDELATSIRGLDTRHADKLADLGVDPFDIVIFQMVGLASVQLDRTGWRWEPAAPENPQRRQLFITPVRLEHVGTALSAEPWETARFGGLVDLIGWHPRNPERWALRTGLAGYLGSIGWADPFPAQIRSSPLSWLKARCDGLVLLTRDPVALRGIFEEFEHGIEVETLALADRLNQLVRQPVARPPVLRAAYRQPRQKGLSPPAMQRGLLPDDTADYTPLREGD